MRSVLIAMPTNSDESVWLRTAFGVMNACFTAQTYRPNVKAVHSSALCYTFNSLWCEFLDGDYDWFCMVHADISPEGPDWLERMLSVADAYDVLSVVSPLKTFGGMTSTAVDSDPWRPRNLGQTEIAELPPTFDNELIKSLYGHRLLINTGLMLVRKGDWCKDWAFNFEDGIAFDGEKHTAAFKPEDWNFSRFLDERGLRYAATTDVHLLHRGGLSFPQLGISIGGNDGQRDRTD